MKKRLSTFIALALALTMLFSNTAYAANDTTLIISDNGYVTTTSTYTMRSVLRNTVNTQYNLGTSNGRAIAKAAQDVVNGRRVTYTQANEIASLVQLGYYSVATNGSISITKGNLRYKNYGFWTSKNCYLVCLSGTDTDAKNTTTGYWTDLLSGFEKDNQYVRNIKAAIRYNIPLGSSIILAGHSLGGMVAQQIAADQFIKDNYDIINTVTFGSPLIDGLSREGMVRRLGDTRDVIPYMSLSSFTNIAWQYAGLNREDGGYSASQLLDAHCLSYQRADEWGSYDPCGEKNAGRQLTLDFSTTHFYVSPVVVTY